VKELRVLFSTSAVMRGRAAAKSRFFASLRSALNEHVTLSPFALPLRTALSEAKGLRVNSAKGLLFLCRLQRILPIVVHVLSEVGAYVK
jgi:hypothetical protein